MKTKLSYALALALLATTPLACKKDEPKDKKEQKAEKPEKKPEKAKVDLTPLAPSEPETKVAGTPVAEDYEEEAARTIRLENLEAELDRLEAEISGF